MKNIHILPTDKPSRLIFNSFHKSFCYQKEIDGMYINDGKVIGADFWGLQKALNNGFKSQNIYITSDEEIKEGDYIINIESLGIFQHHYKDGSLRKQLRKIILTTDQDLIKDGVQAIYDEFLEWFVKNPSCEEVEVRSFIDAFEWRTIYKIIIPKEEKDYTALLKPVGTKQETIEEIAERYYEDEVSINAFINGYKLAKEQFKTNKI
jgi:hypothetical protein